MPLSVVATMTEELSHTPRDGSHEWGRMDGVIKEWKKGGGVRAQQFIQSGGVLWISMICQNPINMGRQMVPLL